MGYLDVKSMTVPMSLLVVVLTALLLGSCSEPDPYSDRSAAYQETASPSAAERNSPIAESLPAVEDRADGMYAESSEPSVDSPAVTMVEKPDSVEANTESDGAGRNEKEVVDLNPGVDVVGDSGFVSWEPTQNMQYAQYEKMDIVVSGPGGRHIERSFGPGEVAALHEDLPDGTYAWESRATPYVPPEVRERMREVRALGDQAAERRLLVELRAQGYLPTEEQARDNIQSGYFTIKDGQVVRSEVTE